MKTNLTFRIWILIILIVFSLLLIFGMPPKFLDKGILIKNVESNSPAFEQGLRSGMNIIAIDGKKTETIQDFSNALQGKYPSEQNVKTIFTTTESEIVYFSKEVPALTVKEIPKTNIKTGLDIAGGSRALIQPAGVELNANQMSELADVVSNRLNVYGIADLKVLPVSDLSGSQFLLIEIAGATPTDLENLISNQGKFEAKINDDVVFIGGERDISSVCRNDATCSGILSCQDNPSGGAYCNFAFSIYLSEAAAEKHAGITGKLSTNTTNPQYLNSTLDLYLDDNLVDSLFISEGLKGRVTTQIQISGSGQGEDQEAAYNDAAFSMNQLQTILITGSLPYKLEIVKLDTISPVLGKEFIRSIFFAALAALVAVAITIFFRYKKIKLSLALLATSFSEIIIILGIASFINWNLDLPSIAGILATIGTGIDQQIIVLDEARQGTSLSIKQRLKRAFAIIIGAYFTALVSLLPLMWAGAGLLKGFAITTIIGITTGVLITRPAFTDMVKKIEE